MKSRVSIVRVEGDNIEAAVREAVQILGGIDRFVEPNGSYLIKPNLFMNKTAEDGATTDTRIVMVLAEMLKGVGSEPVVGECPAMASYARPDIVFDGLGVRQLCKESGVELNVLDRELPIKVENLQAEVVKYFWFPKFALMCDGIINVPKLKTHGLTTLTCAVKNLFGLQQGGSKANHHVRTGNDPERFSRLLIDLYECVRCNVRLNVVDAVVGMEGDGPTTGEPIEVNLILAGMDAVAVDLVASAVIGWDPMEVGTNLVASERGLGPTSLEEIQVVGVPIEEAICHFKRPQTCKPGQVFRDVRMPIVCDEKKCAGCGICAEICPVKAIIFDGTPKFDDDCCIQCFCCMELCSYGALRAVRTDSLIRLE